MDGADDPTDRAKSHETIAAGPGAVMGRPSDLANPSLT